MTKPKTDDRELSDDELVKVSGGLNHSRFSRRTPAFDVTLSKFFPAGNQHITKLARREPRGQRWRCATDNGPSSDQYQRDGQARLRATPCAVCLMHRYVAMIARS